MAIIVVSGVDGVVLRRRVSVDHPPVLTGFQMAYRAAFSRSPGQTDIGTQSGFQQIHQHHGRESPDYKFVKVITGDINSTLFHRDHVVIPAVHDTE